MDLEPSVSPQEVIELFEVALRQPGWIDDKVADQFPRAGSKNASGIPLSDMDNGAITVTLANARSVDSARAQGQIWGSYRRSDQRGVEC